MIPYPITVHEDLETFKGYVSGDVRYPTRTELIPTFDASKKCVHGNPFNQNTTIEIRQAKLYLADFNKEVSIHYQSAIGCECQQYYERGSQFLCNLDSRNIYSYIWLYDILHNMQENHFSIHGAYRSANNTRLIGDQNKLSVYEYEFVYEFR